MKLSKKITILGMMATLLATGSVVYVSSTGGFNFANAADECVHSGNHYTAILPTTSNSGVKEYWVCCNCHEHYLTKPTKGTWVDAGTASVITNTSDDRYIAKLANKYSTYTDAQGVTYASDGKTITKYNPPKGASKDVVIPEGITDIGTVFAGTSVTSITIPSTVGTIDGGAFRNCSSLKSVTITPGVEQIESTGSWPVMHGAFQNCSSLEYIVIPSSVTEMDGYEFASCSSKFKIFVEGYTKRPSGWSTVWNYDQQIGGSPFNTYWEGQWHYDANGVPQPGK